MAIEGGRKLLTDKQIKRYLKYSKSKKKRLRNKAKSRLVKDNKKYGWLRISEMIAKINRLMILKGEHYEL